MSKGTDKEIFGSDEPMTAPSTGGRPQLNRDLAKRLFLSGFTPAQVAKSMDCHVKSARRMRRELEEAGELEKEERTPELNLVQADFEEECKRATGMSFIEWLKTRNKNAVTIFNFCRRVWSKIWDKPSLILTRDMDEPLGDQLCLQFLREFGEDRKRLRTRKKQIRYIFRFLGRGDLCDRHLTMTQSRDPRPVKRIPQIEMFEFPVQYDAAVNELDHGGLNQTIVMFKTISQCRTGTPKSGTGAYGIRIGSGHPSYLIMNSPDDFRCHVVEKFGEEWDITWIPRTLRLRLWEIYKTKNPGDFLFDIKSKKTVKEWKSATEEHIGVEFDLHDCRKVSVTWLYVCGVPLEIATMLNVGWKDLNTPRDHYLHMRTLLKKSDREAYKAKIPTWFNDGSLDEYAREKEV